MTSAVSFQLGRCELSCVLCGAGRAKDADVERALAASPDRVVVSGVGPSVGDLARRARAAGATEVVLRTHAIAAMEEPGVRAFLATGATAAVVPFFSSSSAVHDKIVGRPGALSGQLVGIRALAAAGVRVEVEIPLLSPKLQSLDAIVRLVARALPTTRSVRFHVAPVPVPEVLDAPSWELVREPLAAAVRAARSLGIEVAIGTDDGIPLCILGHEPDLAEIHRFHPKKRARLRRGAVHPPACETCAARAQCGGVSAEAARLGAPGLRPFAKKPPALYAQRSGGAPQFTLEHRKLAGKAKMLVLRPTVHCNQDCTFCSANETSNNVWEEPRAMLAALVRAARLGVDRVSFGGGEPTLARDLVHYVRAASRLGIPKVELVTNAVLLDRPERVAALREAGVTDAFVSLHAHDERLSQVMTRKVGDHARTIRGIQNLVAAGVLTVVNHVITARNYPHLQRFVETVWDATRGSVLISFAFVTPQFKVLEDLTQVPKLSDVMPYMRRAMHRALELGQPFHVGSRQGIPPCFLGEFRPWSDVLDFGTEPAAEDAPQKQLGPKCATCRYRRRCTGLWRPYVERYGLDELEPIVGDPYDDAEAARIERTQWGWPWWVSPSFELAPEMFRDRAKEEAGRAWIASGAAPVAPPVRSLPVLATDRSRPLRTVLVGSGRQARRIAREALDVPGLSIEAVASPRARDAELPELGACPRFSSMEEALAELRPEAVIVAASTHAHHALVAAALAAGVPTLIEKPLARTIDEAEALVRLAASTGVRLVPAYQTLHAAGLETIFEARDRRAIRFVRRSTRNGPEAMRAWSRAAVAETLEHALALVMHALGPGAPRVVSAHFRGDRAPEHVRASLEHDGGRAEVELDFVAEIDETMVVRSDATGARAITWKRRGPETTIEDDGTVSPVKRAGSDVHRMLARFRDHVLGKDARTPTAADARDVAVTVRAVLAALEAAGAPFDREGAPKHASSPQLASMPRERR